MRPSTSPEFGPVFEARNILGLTRQELSSQIGCGISTIRNCEKKGKTFTNRVFVRKLQVLLADQMTEMTGKKQIKSKVIHTSMAVKKERVAIVITYDDGSVFHKLGFGPWYKLELPK